ncbi:MAG: undecaprenyldiphospho-muramoylpentapeptide beta-N-acetylglucosaminyltransferase [Ruminococcaceae bacterium]|nr:undecaprenyldiphospho-muramoylpentapeptide beta-N-acetylglucosaminyltransferase [Oscillospiraceae bacterium]
MKIIFCGGGTAGHVSPAIAIAKYIQKSYKDTSILFVGRDGGEENQAVSDAGFELKTIKINGLERKINLKNIKNVLTAIKALKEAKKIIKEFSPDIVVGTGGYVTWPIIRAANKMKIPTAIHESNACPGLVTKLLAPSCDRVFLNTENSKSEFKRQDNIIISGNPVREEFKTETRESARKKLGINKKDFLISSFGGSGGAKKINEVIAVVMREYSRKQRAIKHVHSCGKKYFHTIRSNHPDLVKERDGCLIVPYVKEMATVICASDIVISRCGAMTISEISAAGTASILIPSPNVTNNHQYKNAKMLFDADAALLIEEKDLDPKRMITLIDKIREDFKKRKKLSQNIKSFYKENTEKIIADEILKLI